MERQTAFGAETRKYKLTLETMLLGTCPSKKNVYEQWVLSKSPVKGADNDDEMDTIQDIDTGATVFHSDDDGVYIMDYHIKGFLKEAGNNLKHILVSKPSGNAGKAIVGIKNLRSKIQNYVFVFPRYIWIAEKHDGYFERPLRAQTAQGPRTALAKSEFISAPRDILFEITMIPNPKHEITWEVIEQLLFYGQFQGLGQFRNGSYGRFTWQYADELSVATA